VPATGGRRGRRDNGLIASQYDPIGDVDPRVGEHLLDVLAGDGIAAYLQPSTDQHPITRTTSLPARPTDRLYVDSDHVATARDYLSQVTADQSRTAVADNDVEADLDASTATATDPEPDVDTAWAEIIAGYHLTAIPQAKPASPRDEVTLDEPRFLPRIDPDADPEHRADAPEVRAWRRADPAEPSLLDALDTFGAHLPEQDDDEGYTPPPPPPLPRISAAAALGVAAIAGGLLLFVWPDLLPMAHNAVLVLAFGLIVAGFATLIWRLRPGDDDEDDDFDDGARI
jgi:hypothetical protein